MVPLSLLIVSMAKGQEDIDAASLNAILPAGYTKVCEDGETPRGAEPRGKRQIGGDGPPPCWSIVDSDFDRTKCSSFEGTCSETKPYVGRGQDTMCIFFPNAGKWFKLGGTYGWCGNHHHHIHQLPRITRIYNSSLQVIFKVINSP